MSDEEEKLAGWKYRIEALENHDIFKIWTSVRKGGKTTLDAILNDHQRITSLEKKVGTLDLEKKLKLDSPKKKCEHKDTSSSSDPLIWYICHDCGAHLNQAFEEISPKTYALHKKVLEDSGGEKEYVELKEKLTEPINKPDNPLYLYVQCPNCNHRISIKKEDIL